MPRLLSIIDFYSLGRTKLIISNIDVALYLEVFKVRRIIGKRKTY